jgi:hypothetical protein
MVQVSSEPAAPTPAPAAEDAELGLQLRGVEQGCGAQAELVRRCAAGEGPDPEACGRASLGLNYCIASVACPPAAAAFMSALESADADDGARGRPGPGPSGPRPRPVPSRHGPRPARSDSRGLPGG